MKRFISSFVAFVLVTSAAFAQTDSTENISGSSRKNTAVINKSAGIRKAMTVVSEDLIDETPAGTVVTDCVRQGFSYFYNSQGLNGGYNGSFTGEYVLGDDGNIYLKNVCASYKTNTYIKLEKIDDENYVAHTAQPILVYDDGSTIKTYYAVRLVFSQISEYSFTYKYETDEANNNLNDIYFTYKNGVLMQKDQKVVTMNEVDYPHELLGIAGPSGSWSGYGDGCIKFSPINDVAAVLPEEAEVKTVSFVYNTQNGTNGGNIANAMLIKYAEYGDNVYINNPSVNNNSWIKGTINRASGKVSFKAQYLGINNEIGCHQWFLPATYSDVRVVYDEEEDYGEWFRTYNKAEEYICNYSLGELVSDNSAKQTFAICRSNSEIVLSAGYSDIVVKPYEAKVTTPMNPSILAFSTVESTGFWGEIHFTIPAVDVNMVYINPEELYYNIYLGDETKPYVFTPDEFCELSSDIVDMPYLYDDDSEFDCFGSKHAIYFYDSDSEFVGVQSIHKFNGEERRSDIVWYNKTSTAIKNPTAATPASRARATGQKYISDGRIVIIHNGKKYSTTGQRIKE